MKTEGKSIVVFFSHAGDNYAVGNIEVGNTKIDFPSVFITFSCLVPLLHAVDASNAIAAVMILLIFIFVCSL